MLMRCRLAGIRTGSTGRKIVTKTALLRSTIFAAAGLGLMAF
ncbi:MAG: sugar ABC transporter substrate-binding protein, partial [Mesorhizobium sp.]